MHIYIFIRKLYKNFQISVERKLKLKITMRVEKNTQFNPFC